MPREEADQPVEHHQAMAAADHLGMHGEVEQGARHVVVGEAELLRPDLLDQRGRFQAGAAAVELEIGEVVERPGDRQLDEIDMAPEDIGRVVGELVARARVVGRVVIAHQAGIVGEAVVDQDVDGALAEVPGGRAVAPGPHAARLLERLEAAVEVGPLAGLVEVGRILVDPAVVGDLVAAVVDAPDEVRIRDRGVPGDAEGAGDAMAFQQGQDAGDRHGAELAAADLARVFGLVGPDPHRHGVEIEGQGAGQARFVHRADSLGHGWIVVRAILASLRRAPREPVSGRHAVVVAVESAETEVLVERAGGRVGRNDLDPHGTGARVVPRPGDQRLHDASRKAAAACLRQGQHVEETNALGPGHRDGEGNRHAVLDDGGIGHLPLDPIEHRAQRGYNRRRERRARDIAVQPQRVRPRPQRHPGMARRSRRHRRDLDQGGLDQGMAPPGQALVQAQFGKRGETEDGTQAGLAIARLGCLDPSVETVLIGL